MYAKSGRLLSSADALSAASSHPQFNRLHNVTAIESDNNEIYWLVVSFLCVVYIDVLFTRPSFITLDRTWKSPVKSHFGKAVSWSASRTAIRSPCPTVTLSLTLIRTLSLPLSLTLTLTQVPVLSIGTRVPASRLHW